MKVCISCGMPMTKPEDYSLRDESKDYCIHCARKDGSMQSFEEKLESMTGFIIRTQGFDPTVATHAAKELMRNQPAWSHCFETKNE
ncbi:zinc ribbon domain-containing protein [Clostridium sp. E02]|uniref:zinc ribbon domain-containing protein n=1 Tax=Clostridium sp. E02 TaxID=2487134 RepID=UPI000F5478E0|nr:zinc ribbon domain-containing protein [Clostridium sp. E02]